MTDLTVLISPMPLYPPMKPGFTFGRKNTTRPVRRPIMVTLETEIEPGKKDGADDQQSPIQSPLRASPLPRPRSPEFDSSLLSPPINTWKSGRHSKPRHRPTRSQSAPPERRKAIQEAEEPDFLEVSPGRPVTPPSRSRPKKSLTSFSATTHGGELVRPPPPLFAEYSSGSNSHSTRQLRTRRFHDITYGNLDRRTDVPNIVQSASATSSFSSPNPAPTLAPLATPTSLIQVANGDLLATPSPSDIPPITSMASDSPQLSDSSSSGPDPAVAHSEEHLSSSGFKWIYLVPILAFLGVLWAGLVAWMAYGCMTRKPRLRVTSDSIAGPRYVPPPDIAQNLSAEEKFLGQRTIADMERLKAFRWPNVQQDVEKYPRELVQEDDPFLSRPSTPEAKTTWRPRLKRAPRTAKSSRSERTAKTTRSNTPTSTASLDVDDSDEGDLIPWEDLRHKSIKRGILEKVRQEGNWINSLRAITGSSFSRNGNVKTQDMPAENEGLPRKTTGMEGLDRRARSRHGKNGKTDSDVRLDEVDLKTPEPASINTRLMKSIHAEISRPPIHSTPSTTTISSNTGSAKLDDDGKGTEWVKGAGFRIVDESPPASLNAPEEVYGSKIWRNGDRYTSIPDRANRSRSESQSRGQSCSPAKVKGDVPNHQLVLPKSPPLVTNPLLEGRLCFTPIVEPKARMASPPHVLVTPSPSPSRKLQNGGLGKQVLSPAQQATLPDPFLSSVSPGDINSPRPDAYQGRRVMAIVRDKEALIQREREAAIMPKKIIAKQEEAMKKVERIVERSWSARDLDEEGVHSLSPTVFGRKA